MSNKESSGCPDAEKAGSPVFHEARRPEQRVVRIEDRIGHGREAILLHGGEEYRLRSTRKGTRSLTK
jgi:hemin uptake protein HemP